MNTPYLQRWKLTSVANKLLVITSALLIAVGVVQGVIFHRQTKIMSNQAKIAKSQLAEMQLEGRAWVSIEPAIGDVVWDATLMSALTSRASCGGHGTAWTSLPAGSTSTAFLGQSRALRKGRPEIFNTDQGAQFTSAAFTDKLEPCRELERSRRGTDGL